MKTLFWIFLFLMPCLSFSEGIDADPIIIQLSEAGYVCRVGEKSISVSKRGQLNFEIFPGEKGLTLRGFFPVQNSSVTEKEKLLTIINTLNSSTGCSKYYVENNRLYVEAFYPLPYIKKSFHAFMSAWEEDFQFLMKEHSKNLSPFIK